MPSNWKLEQPSHSTHCKCHWRQCVYACVNECVCVRLLWVLLRFACIAATHVYDDKFHVNFYILAFIDYMLYMCIFLCLANIILDLCGQKLCCLCCRCLNKYFILFQFVFFLTLSIRLIHCGLVCAFFYHRKCICGKLA